MLPVRRQHNRYTARVKRLYKVRDRDYLDFLIATPKACSGTEAARVSAVETSPPAHDAFTRLLHRLEPDAEVLWHEATSQVERHHGILVLDDAMLDKPYAKKIELVSRHWSGKHHAVVEGIKLITLLLSTKPEEFHSSSSTCR